MVLFKGEIQMALTKVFTLSVRIPVLHRGKVIRSRVVRDDGDLLTVEIKGMEFTALRQIYAGSSKLVVSTGPLQPPL